MKTSFTPGPWMACNTTIGGAITHWHITGKKHGSVYPICNHTLEVEPPVSEQIANAHLIAAAPELLTELEQADKQMEMAGDCIEAGRYDEALLHVRSMCRTRREAIAKARGEI